MEPASHAVGEAGRPAARIGRLRAAIILSLCAMLFGLAGFAAITMIFGYRERTRLKGEPTHFWGAAGAVAASVVADLLAGSRAVSPVLGLVALVVSSVVAMLVGAWFDELSTLAALGIGPAAGTVSWSLRRVFTLSPAMVTVRGQVGAGVGSVLAIGAIVNLFAALG